MRGEASASRGVSVYSELLLVLIAPIHGEMARLSWPGWLVTHRDALPVCRPPPIQVLTVNVVTAS